jgi:endonuclease/exonuclease/phosphatase family metal-dependent hydrolase
MRRENVFVKTGGFQSCCYFILVSIAGLILIQSLRETISSIYYYSLVGMGIHPSLLFVLILFSPLLVIPLAMYTGWRGAWIISGTLAALARFPMSLGLEQPLHLFSSALCLAGTSMFLAVTLSLHRREREKDRSVFSSQSLAAAFTVSIIAQIALVTIGMGYDISIVPEAMGILLAPAISAGLSVGMGFLLYVIKDSRILDERRKDDESVGYTVTGGAVDSRIPTIGLGFLLLAMVSFLTHPTFYSGWNGSDYQIVLSVMLLTSGLFVMSLITNWRSLIALRRLFSNPIGSVIGNLLLIASGVNIFFIHYNFYFSPIVFIWIALVDLWMILDALTDSEPFAGEPVEIRRKDGSKKMLGFQGRKKKARSPQLFSMIFTWALGIYMAVALLETVSVSWAHIPYGEIFKGLLPYFTFGSTVGLAVTGFLCSKKTTDEPFLQEQHHIELKKGSPALAADSGSGHIHVGNGISSRLRILSVVIGSMTLILIIGTSLSTMFLYDGNSDSAIREGDEIRVMTYNIHQGFNNEGRTDPTEMYDIIDRVDPDVIFLQESEGMRIETGFNDPVHYFATRLKMNYIRGPLTGEGTYGVSILSRFPVENARVQFLESDEDQRVAVTCRADLGDRSVNLVSVHIGLSDRDREVQIRQLAEIVDKMAGEVIIGGDFNSEPTEKFMAPLNRSFFGGEGKNEDTGDFLRSFISCYQAVWGNRTGVYTWPASDIDDEEMYIDYILVSQGIHVEDAGIETDSDASDHRPVWADIVP